MSYVGTTIAKGAIVYNLELHDGGYFETPMGCGSYDIGTDNQCRKTGQNCQVKLYGKNNYYFDYPYDDNNGKNLPSVVTCSLESGNPSTEPALLFRTDPHGSGYLFSGTSAVTMSNGSCSLGSAGYNCSNVKCYNYVEHAAYADKTPGKISSSNDCK